MDGTIRREGRIQWLAGLFCGEGCITSYWRSKKKDERGEERIQLCNQASLVNTDKVLIDEAEAILRENEICPIIHWTNSGRVRSLGVIKIVGNNKLQKFLNLILPYLVGTKGEVAKEMISLIEYRKSIKHWGIMKVGENPIINEKIRRIKSLNQNGTLNDYTPSSDSYGDDIV